MNPAVRREIMAKASNHLIGGLAIVAAMIAALPAAQGIDAASKEQSLVQVNRVAKGDRLAAPHTIAVKKAPAETARDIIKGPKPNTKRQVMDGCEPMFSPVTVPTMAHVAGRCVG
jgi:hypothetical protein